MKEPESAHNEADIHGGKFNNQLDPNYLYTITIGGTVMAQMVVSPNLYLQFSTLATVATEYWYVNQSALASLGDTTKQLNISAAQFVNNGSGNPIQMSSAVPTTVTFTSLADVTWVQTLPAPNNGTNYVFNGTPKSPASATVYVLFNVTTVGQNLVLARVYWYLTGLSAAPTNLQPGSTADYTRGGTVPPTVSYYAATSHG